MWTSTKDFKDLGLMRVWVAIQGLGLNDPEDVGPETASGKSCVTNIRVPISSPKQIFLHTNPHPPAPQTQKTNPLILDWTIGLLSAWSVNTEFGRRI